MNIRKGWNCRHTISADVSLLPAMLRQASSVAQRDPLYQRLFILRIGSGYVLISGYTKRERARERERATVNVNGNVALGFRSVSLNQLWSSPRTSYMYVRQSVFWMILLNNFLLFSSNVILENWCKYALMTACWHTDLNECKYGAVTSPTFAFLVLPQPTPHSKIPNLHWLTISSFEGLGMRLV